MNLLSGFLRIEIAVLVTGLVVALLSQMLTGRISLCGPLTDPDDHPSPERAQLLVVTLVAALSYLSQAGYLTGKLPAVLAPRTFGTVFCIVGRWCRHPKLRACMGSTGRGPSGCRNAWSPDRVSSFRVLLGAVCRTEPQQRNG